MQINNVAYARRVLERVNYYRFSGYWYPFRQLDADGRHRLDVFVDGANFTDVAALYDFDERLRSAVFDCLTPVELALKAMLGHELGRLPARPPAPSLVRARSPSEAFGRKTVAAISDVARPI